MAFDRRKKQRAYRESDRYSSDSRDLGLLCELQGSGVSLARSMPEPYFPRG